MNERQQILEEIRQITEQFRVEVPGRRKTWPKAVKQRVMDLKNLGLSLKAISDQTGIPYFTVLTWSSHHGRFKQLSTVTVPISVPVQAKNKTDILSDNAATVTVTTPQGYRIEGINLDQLVVLLGMLA
jgi:hypothetical protein